MFGNLFGGGNKKQKKEDESPSPAPAAPSGGVTLGGAALWSAAPGDPTTATIAMYKRERDAAAGTIIAVSANYTAYGIRGGLIRVIHRHSDAMGLLRGHSHNPQDLAFLAGTDDLVVAFFGGKKQITADVKAMCAANDPPITFLEGGGHWIQQERPADVNAHILAFLDEHWTANN